MVTVMDGGNIAVGAAVIGLVAEAVGAVVVGVRRVGEAAVGIERQRAMRRAGGQDRGQRVAVRRRYRWPARPERR